MAKRASCWRTLRPLAWRARRRLTRPADGGADVATARDSCRGLLSPESRGAAVWTSAGRPLRGLTRFRLRRQPPTRCSWIRSRAISPSAGWSSSSVREAEARTQLFVQGTRSAGDLFANGARDCQKGPFASPTASGWDFFDKYRAHFERLRFQVGRHWKSASTVPVAVPPGARTAASSWRPVRLRPVCCRCRRQVVGLG